jgi:hypothetical protein
MVNARFETNYAWQDTVEKLESLKNDESAYRSYLEDLFRNHQNLNIPID